MADKLTKALDYDTVFWLAMHSGEGPARASQIAHAARSPGSYEAAWARIYAGSIDRADAETPPQHGGGE